MQRPFRLTRPLNPFDGQRVVGLGLLVIALGALSACSGQPDAADTVYRILVEPCAGPDNQRATAVAVGPELLFTVAHSFEEAKSFTMTDNDGQDVPVDIVHLDQAKDIAALRPRDPVDPVLPIGEPITETDVTITTYGDRDGPVTRSGRVLELIDSTMDGEGRRAAIRLDASLEPGDSGAPVVNDDTAMVGMVFAKARGSDIGWAVSSEELTALLDELAGEAPEPIRLSC